VALAQEHGGHGKDGLTLLNDRPLNMETPPHLLDDKITPANRFFIRNNGLPQLTWRLNIGEFHSGYVKYNILKNKSQIQ